MRPFPYLPCGPDGTRQVDKEKIPTGEQQEVQGQAVDLKETKVGCNGDASVCGMQCCVVSLAGCECNGVAWASDCCRLWAVLCGVRCYPMLSDAIRCYPMLSDAIRCYLTLSDAI